MRIKITVDTRQMMDKLKRAPLSERDMLDIEGAGAKVIINSQRTDVPVDTSATKNSINSHITESSSTTVVDEIGPETEYAIYLEYGTGEFAESGKGRKGGWVYKDASGFHFTLGMQPRPFVRPSIFGKEDDIVRAITATYVLLLNMKWQTN